MKTIEASPFHRLLILSVSLLLAGNAWGIPIQWSLQDVEFEDGGTATGSFVYDADTDLFSSLDITTSGGFLSPGATYQTLLVGGTEDLALVGSGNPDLTDTPLLQLIFRTSLSNAGGPVFLFDFDAFASTEGLCLNADCSSASFERFLMSGVIFGEPMPVVPLPPAAGLFIAALGALGVYRRRT